jgi:hypothetical protein
MRLKGATIPMQIREVSEPPPPRKLPGRIRGPLWTALAAMNVGGAGIEVNRGKVATDHYVYKFRKEFGRELRFIVRVTKPGWCRIWRTQ